MAKKAMTKSQIVSYFAEKFEFSKKTAAEIIDEVAALAVSETTKMGSFTLPGIGKLALDKRKAPMGRNAATGAEIKIPAKTVIQMRLQKLVRMRSYRRRNREITYEKRRNVSGREHHDN